MPLAALLVLFIVVPLAELYVIVQVGQSIGLVPTLAILFADSIVGSLLLRSQGRTVWRRFNEAVQGGRVPHREIVDGVMIITGGALLLTPGFLTDVVGLLLLFPPSRAIARRLVARTAARRVVLGLTGAAARPRRRSRPAFGGGAPPATGRPYDVEGTATEAPDPRRLER